MLIVGFLAYILIGVVAIYVAMLAHLISAEMKGYDAIDWWYYRADSIRKEIRNNHKHNVIFGIIIWPVRIVQFKIIIAEYYDLYELKQNF